ncbi:MAG: hypothetical protein ACYSW3_30760 [Planctomycetota bacterium]|jgi:hypothetical protein
MKRMKKLWLLFLLAACSSDEDCVPVEIVAVTFDEESGVPDYYTVVQFPDSTRRLRFNKWGE